MLLDFAPMVYVLSKGLAAELIDQLLACLYSLTHPNWSDLWTDTGNLIWLVSRMLYFNG